MLIMETHYRVNITPEFMNVSVGDRQVRGMINAMILEGVWGNIIKIQGQERMFSNGSATVGWRKGHTDK